MRLERSSRRRFLLKASGMFGAVALTHAVGDPIARGLWGVGWPPVALADVGCFDPIADQTGWFKDGDETFQTGSSTAPLVIIDDTAGALPGQKPYCTLYCPASASLFSSDIRLAPSFVIDAGHSPAGDDTGVEVRINDGTHEIRVSLRDVGGILKLALVTGSGPSAGIALIGREATFELARETASGKVFLRMNGQTEEADLINFSPPGSGRSNTIEFGTYDVAATSTTRWTTLGLPQRTTSLVATFDLHPKTINKKAKGQYITGYVEFAGAFDPADIDVSTVTLQAIDPVTSTKLNVAAGSPTAVGDGNANGVVDRSLKFDRATVQSWFSTDTPAVFRVEGRLSDGRMFSGDAASVRVINAGIEHADEANAASVKY